MVRVIRRDVNEIDAEVSLRILREQSGTGTGTKGASQLWSVDGAEVRHVVAHDVATTQHGLAAAGYVPREAEVRSPVILVDLVQRLHAQRHESRDRPAGVSVRVVGQEVGAVIEVLAERSANVIADAQLEVQPGG